MIQMKKCPILSRVKGGRLFRPNCRDVGAKQAWRVIPDAPMRNVPALFLCLIAGFLGSFAYADRPVISLHGGCIAPSKPNDNIRLDVLHVTFRSKRDSYSVDARYHLFNTGKTVTVTVGVPKYGRPDRDEKGHASIVRDFLSFDAWVDGRKAEFVEASDFFTDPSARPVGGYCHGDKPSETRWMTKRVTFTGKATTFIRVRYEAHYHNHSVGSGILAETGYYHDSVGRYWKDNIKKAVFILDATDINEGQPGPHSYEGRVAFTNFISVDEIRKWEPSSRSYRRILGSWLAAQWRSPGGLFRLLPGPGVKHRAAPTPCDRSQW